MLQTLARPVLILLTLTAAAWAADAGIHKTIWRSGATTLIISIEEMEDLMKIVKFLEDSGLIIKGVTQTIQNKAKDQKCRCLSTLLGTLGAGLLGNMLTGKRNEMRRWNKQSSLWK